MIGVIELDAIAVNKTECHVWTEREELQQKSANFGSTFMSTPRLGCRMRLRIDLETHPPWSRRNVWPLFFLLRGRFGISFPFTGVELDVTSPDVGRKEPGGGVWFIHGRSPAPC